LIAKLGAVAIEPVVGAAAVVDCRDAQLAHTNIYGTGYAIVAFVIGQAVNAELARLVAEQAGDAGIARG